MPARVVIFLGPLLVGGYVALAQSGGAATPLVINQTFSGLSADQWQIPSGTPPTIWGATDGSTSDLALGGLYSADGLKKAGNWNEGVEPRGDGVIAAASRTGEAGDRGFRHTFGVGVNQGGGSIVMDFAPYEGPWRELWLQWWQRYGAGLTVTNEGPGERGNGVWSYEKAMGLNNDNLQNDLRVDIGNGQGGGGSWGIATVDTSPQARFAPNRESSTWQSQQGGKTGSGKWNRYQIHVKADSGTSNGVYEAWFNGTLIARYTKINFSNGNGSHTGWRSLRITNNQSAIGTDSPAASLYTDIDDIKVSIAGYITQP